MGYHEHGNGLSVSVKVWRILESWSGCPAISVSRRTVLHAGSNLANSSQLLGSLTRLHILHQWRTQEFCSGWGGSTNSVEDRENGGLGGGSPLSGVLEAAVIWYKKFHFI